MKSILLQLSFFADIYPVSELKDCLTDVVISVTVSYNSENSSE
jgi:hypothetical protein